MKMKMLCFLHFVSAGRCETHYEFGSLQVVVNGKGIEGVKADLLKPEKKEREGRKALAALELQSVEPTSLKGSTLKQKSSLRGGEKIRKAPKTRILTDEEIKKCEEWAKEGIEKVHFTGTDQQKHERDAIEKRVKKKVDMVMSCMSKWSQVLYDCITPVKKIAVDIGDIKRLEPEPEVLLPVPTSSLTSGFEVDPILEEPESLWPSYVERFELKLKEGYEGNAAF